jgi:integrase
MAVLRALKNGGGIIFYVDYVYQGRRYRKSTRTNDRKLAELFLKDIEVKIAKENFGFEDLIKKKIRLSDFIDKYLKFSKATKARSTCFLDGHFLRLFKSHMGDIQLDRISASDIETYKIKRLETVKPTSVNIELKHLKSAFGSAERWGHILKNPFRGVKLVRIKNSNLPKFLTKTEVNELLDSIDDKDFKDLIVFYLYTGCRRSEALQLTWKDIDLENCRVTFRGTKSGEDRVVPINGVLSELFKVKERNGDHPFPFKHHYVTHKLKKYLRASSIKNREALHLHHLRHTYASHLVMSGADLYTVCKLLGHSSVKVTEMYAHLVPDYLKVAVERLRY